MKTQTETKALVESDWIKMWDSIKPLEEPLIYLKIKNPTKKQIEIKEKIKRRIDEIKQRDLKQYPTIQEIKERKREYNREYHQRPEIKERQREYYKRKKGHHE